MRRIPFWKYFVATFLLIICLFPFFWMLITSFKPEGEALLISLPKRITIDNYRKIFFQYRFYKYFVNSFIVATTSALVSTLLASLAAYGFAKKEFPLKNFLFWFFISSMMVPGLLYVIPQFLIVYQFRWINRYEGMIVPHLANVFGMFLITQFLKDLPDSLLESARIDGASEIKIFVKIVIPLALPVVATVFLLNFQFHWANFLWQLLVAQTESMYTVPVGLAMFKSAHEEAYALKMAASTVSLLPIMVLFFIAQRYFIEGITQGALKE
uniref:Carbohydrate ABC transporter permease n=2 Tax=candidate division WOR-3 bacterium TaxID=2052148 RepID=A0A7V3ZWP8_UNCW3